MLIDAFGAASFFFLSYVLFIKSFSDNQLANLWLAIFLLLVGAILLDSVFLDSGTYLQFPHLFNIVDLFTFGTAPCWYIAVSYFTQPSRRFNPDYLWHFFPTLLLVIVSIPFFLLSVEAKRTLIEEMAKEQKELTTSQIVVFGILFLQFTVYLILSYLKIIRHQKNIQLITSNKAEKELNWLKFMVIGVTTMMLMWMMELVFLNTTYVQESGWGYLLGCYFLGFFAIRQKEIYPFAQQELEEINEIINEQATKPPELIPFDPQQKEKLITLIETQKPYLDPELNLPKLAELMDSSTHKLSNLINQGFEQNFYQLINSYRIEESKRLLQDPKLQHLGILQIGYEAGFNSKTTFNTAFKNATGLSPLEYRKQRP